MRKYPKYPLCGTLNNVMCGNVYGGCFVQSGGKESYALWENNLPFVPNKVKGGTFSDCVNGIMIYPIDSQSVGEPQGRTDGLQLFDYDSAEDNKYQQYDVTGGNTAIITASNYWSTGYIDLKDASKRGGKTTVYLSRGCTSGMFYTADKTQITSTVLHDIQDSVYANKEVTIPENARYLYLSFAKSDYDVGAFKTTLMICLGGEQYWERYTGGIPSPNILYPVTYNNEISKDFKLQIASSVLWKMDELVVAKGVGSYSVQVGSKGIDTECILYFNATTAVSKVQAIVIIDDGFKEIDSTVKDNGGGLYSCRMPYGKIMGLGFYNNEAETGVTYTNIRLCINKYGFLPFDEREYREVQEVAFSLLSPLHSLAIDNTKEVSDNYASALIHLYENSEYAFISDSCGWNAKENEWGAKHFIKKLMLSDLEWTHSVNSDKSVRTFISTLSADNKPDMSFYTNNSPLAVSNVAKYKVNITGTLTNVFWINRVGRTYMLMFYIDGNLINDETDQVEQFKTLCKKSEAFVMYVAYEVFNVVTGIDDATAQAISQLTLYPDKNNILQVNTGESTHVKLTALGKVVKQRL